jgi:hypothetical protein
MNEIFKIGHSYLYTRPVQLVTNILTPIIFYKVFRRKSIVKNEEMKSM